SFGALSRSAGALHGGAVVVEEARRGEALEAGLVPLVLAALLGLEDLAHERPAAAVLLDGLQHGLEVEELLVGDLLEVIERAIEEPVLAGEVAHGGDELLLGGLSVFSEAFLDDDERGLLHGVLAKNGPVRAR